MRKNTCIISFVASLTLATLIAFGSKCLSATPFGEAQIEIAQKRISEEESVKGPEHYSRIYDHGFRTQKSLLIMHGLHESPRYMEGFAQFF